MAELGRLGVSVRAAVSKASGDANAWIDAYASKDGWFRLDQAQRRLEAWVANLDDEPEERPLGVVRGVYDDACRAMADKVRARLAWFDRSERTADGAYVIGSDIVWQRNGSRTTVLPVSEIPLKGAHNVENVLAGVAIAMLAGCDAAKVREAVRTFKAVEHRLEFVAEIQGVQYFNDSKATNVDATIKALESFPKSIHLILGGKDKGSDYTVLRPLIDERVKRVYTIGAAAEKIEKHLEGVPLVSAKTIQRAVELASDSAGPGDIVLLAPACASFDQFQSYEHRGRVFKELVMALAGKAAARG
jgi:UDP-N-acetylmuramoylalanine--D-glutamate ligase